MSSMSRKNVKSHVIDDMQCLKFPHSWGRMEAQEIVTDDIV